MSDAVDKYFKPTILSDSPILQESCYKSILHYCQILQGKEFPWNMLCNSVERADIHSRIAGYCDCDDDVVTEAVDKIFPDSASLEDDVFLENVDKLVDALKDVARLPSEQRFPSLLPKGWEKEAERELESISIPDMGVINAN